MKRAAGGETGNRGHAVFLDFLAEIRPQDLGALRHLVLCPLCQKLSRLILVEPPGNGAPPDAASPEGTMREDETVGWLLDCLKLAMRLLEVTNRRAETANGWSHGYLSRIFAGTIELRVDHIVALTEIVGLSPAEFFHFAYPERPAPLSPAAVRLDHLLRRFQPSVRPPRPSTRKELEQELFAAWRREVVAASEEAPGVEVEPG